MNRKNIELAIEEFNERYPRPGIDPIAIKGEYDLAGDWPNTYPNVDSAGVYIFLDEAENLLYVGKTSCNSSFGSRLGAYFMYGEDRTKYKVKNEYYADVKKILTIPLPKGHEFEAGAIEEYLIQALDPKLNIVGRKASNNAPQPTPKSRAVEL